LTLLVYEAFYPHILQVEVSGPASVLSSSVVDHLNQQIIYIIRVIVTQHPERRRLDFKEQHYAMVAWHFMLVYLSFRYAPGVRSIVSTLINGLIQPLV